MRLGYIAIAATFLLSVACGKNDGNGERKATEATQTVSEPKPATAEEVEQLQLQLSKATGSNFGVHHRMHVREVLEKDPSLEAQFDNEEFLNVVKTIITADTAIIQKDLLFAATVDTTKLTHREAREAINGIEKFIVSARSTFGAEINRSEMMEAYTVAFNDTLAMPPHKATANFNTALRQFQKAKNSLQTEK